MQRTIESSSVNFADCPVPILQNEWEFGVLYNLYFNLHPKNIIEIGSFYGGTLWYWLRDFYLSKLCVIDLPITKIDPRFKKMQECRNLWNVWLEGVEDFEGILADSRDEQTVNKAHKIFNDKDADMLFIDGDHTKQCVKADYENYSPLVRKNGLIVFHDILSEAGVREFWQEVKIGRKHIEIMSEFGIGILYGI